MRYKTIQKLSLYYKIIKQKNKFVIYKNFIADIVFSNSAVNKHNTFNKQYFCIFKFLIMIFTINRQYFCIFEFLIMIFNKQQFHYLINVRHLDNNIFIFLYYKNLSVNKHHTFKQQHFYFR